MNSAGAYIRPLAGICLEVMEALDIPVCLNLYITAAGQKTSAPPHTDKQDVFVMQTQVGYSIFHRRREDGGKGVGCGKEPARL